jgi:uncharacterized protein YbjT (DUF2867 family)
VYVVMGATGHVGSAVMNTLLQKNEPVVALTHDPQKQAALERRGAQVAIADVCDVEALRSVFASADRVFVLNPPGNPAADSAAEEERTIDCIVRALQGSGVEKVVVESTFGAQPGKQLGDLGTLYTLEQKLGATQVASSVVRAAYYMSNWEMSLESAMTDGVIATLYPIDMPLPMAAPEDLGRVGAELLSAPAAEERCVYVEGPQRYSSNDVAAAFAAALGRPVVAREIPRAEWATFLAKIGFSPESAESFARMTALTRAGVFPDFDATMHGRISLQQYVTSLVKRARKH